MKEIAFSLLLSLIFLANSPFNGAWIIDIPSAVKDIQSENYLLDQGKFTRGDAKSKVSVKADGRFHSIGQGGYVDEVSVSVLRSRKIIEQNRLKGKLVYSILYSVSPDGKTMVRTITDFSKPDQRPVSTTINYRRVSLPKKSDSFVTGQWQITKLTRAKSDLIDVLKLDDNRFSLRGSGGRGYDAEIGGSPVPMAGDAADARAAVSMPNDQTIVVNMSRSGVPTVTMTMKMQPNGREIKVSARRHSDGNESSWLMYKQ